MRQSEHDELQRLLNEEQQNLCSKGKPLIQKLLDETTPVPDPPPPPGPVELRVDLDHIVNERLSRGRQVASVDVAELVAIVNRCLTVQRELEEMGEVARQRDNRPFPHSHYSAAAAMLRRALDGKCVTPTGRTDSHGLYVETRDGKMVCAFCKREV